MLSRLRSLYRRLPLVKELKQLGVTMRRIETYEKSRLQIQQEMYFMQHLQQPRYAHPKNLTRFGAQVFSQSGEDGIIAEIMRRIGIQSHTFVEIGSGHGAENNTAFLLLQGWSGCWIDGDESQIAVAQRRFRTPIDEGRLKSMRAFVTAENIASLLNQLAVPEEIDVLSVDVDRNTYWLWAALPHLRARVVIVEYNATFPPDVDWKVHYAPDRQWNWTTYYGASLKAFENLGRTLGYSLVGCTLDGVNAFFVRQDLCADKFQEPFTAEQHYEPFRFFFIPRINYRAGFADDPEA